MKKNMKEIWRPIKSYEGLYEVSSLGKIKSLPIMIKKNGTPFLKKEKIMANYNNGKSYRYISLTKDGVRTNFYVHRIVATAFLPRNEFKTSINHKNCNKGDNRLVNLEWCNNHENMQHAYLNGLLTPPNIKLNNEKVIEIRALWDSGIHRDIIKERYGISFTQIHRIVHRQLWKHI